MARRGVLGVLVGGMAAVLSGCGSTKRMRYKMTVEVDTPEGLKTGYAVREITVSAPPSVPMLGEDKGSVKVKGEAVAVDLPNGRTLFALLKSGDGNVDYAGRDVWFLFRELAGAAPSGIIELWPRVPKTSSPVIADPLPMLVTFGDLADPQSVVPVQPEALEKSLGTGITLRRVVVQASNEPITIGIAKRLRWLPQYFDKLLNGDSIEWMHKRETAAHLGSGSFSTLRKELEK